MTTSNPSNPRGAAREHFSREELLRWLERGDDEERGRVESHLALCDACGDLHRELVEEEERRSHPRRLDVARFVARGVDRSRLAVAPPRTRRSVVWASAAAALAASLFLATFLPRLFREAPADVFRGEGPRAVAPVGAVGEVPRFEWSGASDAVLLEIFDRSRSPIYSVRRRGSSMPVDAALATLLQPDEAYSWMVTRLDARGGRLESSALVEFRLTEP